MQQQQAQSKKDAAIPAVNYHLRGSCNMRCRFCFARFKTERQESKEVGWQKSLAVIAEASRAGIAKITFAGGEPLLCPWLADVLKHSKAFGMTTMVVTNGSLVTDRWLGENARYIDWLALSIDSPVTATNFASGRAVGGIRPLGATEYRSLAAKIRRHNIRLKVNVTVSRFNVEEDPSSLLLEILPERLKVFQVLPIFGHNDHCFADLGISIKKFSAFVRRLDPLRNFCQVVVEDNEAMTGSYLMIDPQGRFFSNTGGRYRFSLPVWQVGWATALSEIETSVARFRSRGGFYSW